MLVKMFFFCVYCERMFNYSSKYDFKPNLLVSSVIFFHEYLCCMILFHDCASLSDCLHVCVQKCHDLDILKYPLFLVQFGVQLCVVVRVRVISKICCAKCVCYIIAVVYSVLNSQRSCSKKLLKEIVMKV